ncbi:hypothetical protein SBP8a_7 [Bacillus phage SBP8a]|nr:hypothetical protein SBP8a_7 [Bacillus phage SBP8a]
MTRHTRNRQMVEINRRNPHKKLMLRHEMSSINVTMESIYREPVVWDLDPNFHTARAQLYIHKFDDLLHMAINKRPAFSIVHGKEVTVYYYTFKQPHYSGEGRYFYRIIGVDKKGNHYYSGKELPEHMKGIFDKEGYRLVIDHGNGTHSKTY